MDQVKSLYSFIIFCNITLFTFNFHNVTGELPRLNISYKPQKISPKSQCIVRVLLHEKIRDAYLHSQV